MFFFSIQFIFLFTSIDCSTLNVGECVSTQLNFITQTHRTRTKLAHFLMLIFQKEKEIIGNVKEYLANNEGSINDTRALRFQHACTPGVSSIHLATKKFRLVDRWFALLDRILV